MLRYTRNTLTLYSTAMTKYYSGLVAPMSEVERAAWETPVLPQVQELLRELRRTRLERDALASELDKHTHRRIRAEEDGSRWDCCGDPENVKTHRTSAVVLSEIPES